MKNRIISFFPSLTFSSPFLTFLFPLLLTFLTLLVTNVASAQIPASGLVGYWPFNGNANDASGNGNNGTVNGGALLVTDRNGNVNAAYQFDGIDDFIQMTQAGPTGNTAVTVSFWMRTTMAVNNGPGEGVGQVFGYGANDINQPGRSFIINVNGTASVNSCNQAITFDSYGASLSKTDVFNNSWNHYSIVNDPSAGDNVINQKIYKNGVLMSQTCYSSPGVPAYPTNFSNVAPIRIGKFYGNNCANCQVGIPYFFQGALDDFSMYNRVLTPSEINQLYTDQTSLVEVPCTPFLGEDQTVCAGTSVTLSASGSSLACPTLPATLQNGLAGYWPFCGNANDASGNGNNGTVNGATLTTDRFGNDGLAYSFDGNSWIDIPSTTQNNLPNQLTLSCWLKTTSILDNAGVLGKWNDFDGIIQYYQEQYAFHIWHSGGGLHFWTKTSNQVGAKENNNEYNNGLWHHYIGTWDGINMKLFRDGILTQTSPQTGSISNYNQNFEIGRYSGGMTPATFFQGSLDDIGIWNRALTAAEIQQLYTLGQTTYLWSNGATTPTINVTPTTTTTYTCTVTNNGVSCTDSVTVVVSNPVIDLGADVSVCGTSTTLTAPSGYDSYVWSNGGTTNTTTVTANGTFTCTVTQGGCSASDAVDVTLIDATITASDTTICAGETTTLSVPQGGTSNTACAALPTNLQTGLVGYWPFCGNANDASGNGNNGTVNGATLTTDRFGNINTAYSFNGSSNKIAVPDANSIDFSNNYSFGGWYNTSNTLQLDQTILGKGNPGGGTGYSLAVNIGTTPRKLQFGYNNGPGTNPINGGANTPVSASNLSGWHYLAGTYDGTFAKLYLDGVLMDSNIITYTLQNSTQPLLFGSETNNLGRFFNGNLDDIGLWNRSLSASEVQQLYTLGQTTYLWSNGATTPTINVSPTTTTTYTCTVTTNGVSCTQSIIVTVDTPTATITPATATTFCQGGSVVLNANTGTGLSYQWKLNGISITGATSSTYTANASGSYTVVVTNASTCSSTSTATVVTVNALPTATVTPATATTFCQGGSVVLNANTGTGLTYQWFNNATAISGATSASYTATTSGSYTVTVTNASTCSSTSTTTVVTVNALPTATITPATATTFCQGGSVVLNANTGTSLTYQWFNNASAISGATAASYTGTTSGSYTVVVTNASTCSSTSAATVVTVNALPTATITASSATTFCQGGSVVLSANTGSGLSYQWRLNGNPISGATSSSYTANASGSYTVVVTNASTCSSTSTATIVTVNALPTATITPATATTFCQGGSVILNANTGAGLSYQWRLNGNPISGATSSSYTANASGSYTVVVTNASTCSITSTATVVTVNALPTATITASSATTFCQGASVVLTANTGAGLSYQWYNNASAISGATNASYTANASGSYTVVVTNASTCSSTSTATVVTANALPTATITAATATTFCQGGSVVLNANSGTGLSYQWRLNGNPISGATSASYTATTSGSYTVVVTNASACSSTSTATVVTVNALSTATITAATATTFCQGGSVVLNANTGAGLTYQWRLNGNPISGATSSSYTANASGSYTVVVTNASACSSTSTATVVTVNALPTATITPATATTFCQGGSVVLNANTGAGLTYQWFNNASAISGATSASYTANASGPYTVTVTNTSTCSSTSTATVVTVNALPTATITPATATTFCQGGSVVLNANTGAGLSYQWRLNGNPISGATSSSYTANASGSYTVVVTNASTCSSTSTATVVTVNALPTATITASSATTFCQGGSVVLTANTGTGLSYQWYNNASAIGGATSASYTANASGSYTVVVTNTSTCSATSTATVVTVNALPTATITPATATTFCQGGSVVLNANTGIGLSYQWRLNGTNITGATTSSYTANASGSYTVVVTNTSACSSTSAAINVTAVPNVNYYADADGDGFGDAATLVSTCVQPQGYVTDNTDCKDNDAAIFPGAQEICNDIDDDCNDLIDDGLVFTTYYADADGDSFGDINNPLDACVIPAGYVTNSADCNDNNANQNTASTEICNGEDDDCDGIIDNGLIFLDYYADLDSDGFGAGTATNSCVDLGAGYVTNNTDCNDNNANQNTASTEICNGEDDDCDGAIDNGLVFLDFYSDIDGDGFGSGDVISSCSDLGAGYVTNNTDCDDSNSNINSSATETCNSIDDNCDGQIDEGVQTVYFIDNDGDTYGNPSVSILACTQPIGYTPDDTDCNDTDANINPGAEDIGGNGIDENCDGEIDNSIFELNAIINLYPNPTRSELNIQVNSSVIGNDMYIFDAVGKLVHKQQLLSTQTTVSVSNLADGNYIVRVGELVKRFVMQK